MKKALLVLTILLFAGVTFAQSQVQSGTFFYSKDKNGDNYTLRDNQGKRLVEYEINFNKPFDKKPKVIISTTLIDAERSTQIRYNIRATGISRDGFVLMAEVWGDTQFNSIGGSWLAHTEE